MEQFILKLKEVVHSFVVVFFKFSFVIVYSTVVMILVFTVLCFISKFQDVNLSSFHPSL